MPAPPLINGIRYDVSSYVIKINGRSLSTLGIKSITYSDGLEAGEIYGTSPVKIGRTRGKYTCDASMEMWMYESIEFETSLTTSDGIGEIAFTLSIQIYEPGNTPVDDVLYGCRLKKRDMDMPAAGGSDGAAVKYELDVMRFERNGKCFVSKPQRT